VPCTRDAWDGSPATTRRRGRYRRGDEAGLGFAGLGPRRATAGSLTPRATSWSPHVPVAIPVQRRCQC